MTPGIRLLHTVEQAEVWEFDLDRVALGIGSDHLTLSAAEVSRAARLQTARRRDRFLASRFALRHTLALATGQPSDELEFSLTSADKPFLPGGPEFSLAHTDGLALCAVSAVNAVGVDIERVREVPEAAAIMTRWFTEGEREDFRRWSACLGPDLAFARLWTRKEAYLKGLGIGFSEDLRIAQDPDPGRWHVCELPIAAGYAAALAVARRD